MKKILLAVLAVALLTGSSLAAVNISGDMEAALIYNKDATPQYALGFYRVWTILDIDAVDGVGGKIALRPDLYADGSDALVDSAYLTIGDFLVPALNVKIGLFEMPFISHNRNLMLYPATYDARHRAGGIALSYDWDMAKLEGALCNSGTGLLSPGAEGAKSFTLRVSSDKLLEGLYLGLGYKNIAIPGERVSTLGVSAQYKFEQFILDGEYVGQISGNTKPIDWFVSVGYNITEDLLASISYEGFKDDPAGRKSILSGGIKYQYKPNLAGIIEVENIAPESGSSTTTFYLGVIYTY